MTLKPIDRVQKRANDAPIEADRVGGVFDLKIHTESHVGSQNSSLRDLIAESGLAPLTSAQYAQFDAYLGLFMRWNARVNLSAIRTEEGVISRHFLESSATAQRLPLELSSLLDFGSGGGLPGIPIAFLRPDIELVLAESQRKKSVFLREVVRSLGLKVRVHAGRAEDLDQRFEGVIMRAVDRMEGAVRAAAALVKPSGSLYLMVTRDEIVNLESALGGDWVWQIETPLPSRDKQVLLIGKKLG